MSEQDTASGKRSEPLRDRQLCRVCEGNGVIKIPGGISVCPRCDGDCWDPDRDERGRGAMTDRVQELRERLEQIRVRAEKSTPEPWHAHGKPHPEAVRLRKEAAGVSSAECLIYLSSRDYVCLPETFARQQADAEFIAHARQDVPWLLGQIDALLRAASSCLVPRTPEEADPIPLQGEASAEWQPSVPAFKVCPYCRTFGIVADNIVYEPCERHAPPKETR